MIQDNDIIQSSSIQYKKILNLNDTNNLIKQTFNNSNINTGSPYVQLTINNIKCTSINYHSVYDLYNLNANICVVTVLCNNSIFTTQIYEECIKKNTQFKLTIFKKTMSLTLINIQQTINNEIILDLGHQLQYRDLHTDNLLLINENKSIIQSITNVFKSFKFKSSIMAKLSDFEFFNIYAPINGLHALQVVCGLLQIYMYFDTNGDINIMKYTNRFSAEFKLNTINFEILSQFSNIYNYWQPNTNYDLLSSKIIDKKKQYTNLLHFANNTSKIKQMLKVYTNEMYQHTIKIKLCGEKAFEIMLSQYITYNKRKYTITHIEYELINENIIVIITASTELNIIYYEIPKYKFIAELVGDKDQPIGINKKNQYVFKPLEYEGNEFVVVKIHTQTRAGHIDKPILLGKSCAEIEFNNFECTLLNFNNYDKQRHIKFKKDIAKNQQFNCIGNLNSKEIDTALYDWKTGNTEIYRRGKQKIEFNKSVDMQLNDIFNVKNKKMITWTSDDSIHIKCKKFIIESDDMVFKTKNTHTIESDSIKQKAKKTHEISAMNIKQKATQTHDISAMNIKQKATQTHDISAMNIKQKANLNYEIQALNVKQKATIKYNVEALIIEQKSKVSYKITSLMCQITIQVLFKQESVMFIFKSKAMSMFDSPITIQKGALCLSDRIEISTKPKICPTGLYKTGIPF